MERKLENKAVLVFTMDELKQMIARTFNVSVTSLHNVYINESKDSIDNAKLTVIISEVKEDTVTVRPTIRTDYGQ